MENLYFNLSEEEFSKGRKLLIWAFAGLFFLSGIYVLIASLVLGHKSINASLSAVPFGISIVVSVIAAFATIKRKDLFFSIDNEKIEFRYGLLKPKKHSFEWIRIKEVIMPSGQKKAILVFEEGSSFMINLNWLQKHKAALIRKRLYYFAREKNINILRVRNYTAKA